MAVNSHGNRWRATIYDKAGKRIARKSFLTRPEALLWEQQEKARRVLYPDGLPMDANIREFVSHLRWIERPDYVTRVYEHLGELGTRAPEKKYQTQPPDSMLVFVPDQDRVRDKKSPVTLREALERYRDHVVPTHKAVVTEQNKVNVCLRAGFVNRRIVDLTKSHFSRYLEDRIRVVAPATGWMEIKLFRRAIEYAKERLDVKLDENPAGIKAPRGYDVKRTRRLLPGEEEKLLAGAYPLLRDIIITAIDTAMRQNEIVQIDPSWFREFGSARAHLVIPQSVTKTNSPRSVPVSKRVEEILTRRSAEHPKGRVFLVLAKSICKQFIILTRRLKIADLRFHDLRHEAVSRLGSRLSTLDTMKMSGHRSVPMALRYHHPDIGALSERLRQN